MYLFEQRRNYPMKKLLLFASTLLLAGGLAAAQDAQPANSKDTAAQAPQSQSNPSQSNPDTAQTNVGGQTDKDQQLFKGCIGGSKDNYILTAQDGTTYRLHSDKDITEHVGQSVELRGTVKPEGADRSSQAGAAPQQKEIDVAGVKTVAQSCSQK
jgi:Protein of unknown function (DUF5818)